jgi:hypothetical protein
MDIIKMCISNWEGKKLSHGLNLKLKRSLNLERREKEKKKNKTFHGPAASLRPISSSQCGPAEKWHRRLGPTSQSPNPAPCGFQLKYRATSQVLAARVLDSVSLPGGTSYLLIFYPRDEFAHLLNELRDPADCAGHAWRPSPPWAPEYKMKAPIAPSGTTTNSLATPERTD